MHLCRRRAGQLEQPVRQAAPSFEQFLYCLEHIANTFNGTWKGQKRFVHLKPLNARGSLNNILVEVRPEKMQGQYQLYKLFSHKLFLTVWS